MSRNCRIRAGPARNRTARTRNARSARAVWARCGKSRLDLLARGPVGGEVVPPAQPVVPHPGRMRRAHVEPRRRRPARVTPARPRGRRGRRGGCRRRGGRRQARQARRRGNGGGGTRAGNRSGKPVSGGTSAEHSSYCARPVRVPVTLFREEPDQGREDAEDGEAGEDAEDGDASRRRPRGPQRREPRRRGGHPLVGGGQRHPHVPRPARTVHRARRNQDPAFGSQQLGRRPAVMVRVRQPQVQPGLRVLHRPPGLRERRPKHRTPVRVPLPLRHRVRVVVERRRQRGLHRGRHDHPGLLADGQQLRDQRRVAGHEPGPVPGQVRPLGQRVHRQHARG